MIKTPLSSLEHWAPAAEENILAGYGYKMWRNRSYDVVPATTGAGGGSFADMGITSHVSYFDSHDEETIGRTCDHGRPVQRRL